MPKPIKEIIQDLQDFAAGCTDRRPPVVLEIGACADGALLLNNRDLIEPGGSSGDSDVRIANVTQPKLFAAAIESIDENGRILVSTSDALPRTISPGDALNVGRTRIENRIRVGSPGLTKANNSNVDTVDDWRSLEDPAGVDPSPEPCQDCGTYGGDEYDNAIRFKIGCHPSCVNFKKRLFAFLYPGIADRVHREIADRPKTLAVEWIKNEVLASLPPKVEYYSGKETAPEGSRFCDNCRRVFSGPALIDAKFQFCGRVCQNEHSTKGKDFEPGTGAAVMRSAAPAIGSVKAPADSEFNGVAECDVCKKEFPLSEGFRHTKGTQPARLICSVNCLASAAGLLPNE